MAQKKKNPIGFFLYINFGEDYRHSVIAPAASPRATRLEIKVRARAISFFIFISPLKVGWGFLFPFACIESKPSGFNSQEMYSKYQLGLNC